ncbi:MAG: hypothetical protein WC082_14730, partial [Victivallales bacterium]
MKFTKLLLAIVSATLLSGCQHQLMQGDGVSVKPLSSGEMPAPEKKVSSEKAIGQPVEPLKLFSQIAPARIPVQVVSGKNQTGFRQIKRVIEGNIANAGYEVTDEKPYLIVAVENGKVDVHDKIGNYYVIKSRVEMTVHRNEYDYAKTVWGNPHLLARTVLKAKGKRTLDKDEAIDDSADKLAAEAAKWTRDVCVRELQSLGAVRVKFPVSNLDRIFDRMYLFEKVTGRVLPRHKVFEQCMTLILKKIAAKKSIFYCQIVERNSDFISLEVLYRKKDYPNGP